MSTKIEWADETVNVVNGCSLASPGCTNCYAMRLAGTRMKNHPTRAGLTVASKAGPVWTGEVRFNERALLAPLRWRQPRKIFWNAHGDLFHPNVPDEWIDRCFASMALTPQHIHQVLTKRGDRMRAYANDPLTLHRIAREMDRLTAAQVMDAEEVRSLPGFSGYFASSHGHIYSEKRGARRRLRPDIGDQGHMRVQLHREGKSDSRGERYLVHRLVLEAFAGAPPSPDAQGRHLDGDATNNAIRNLVWGDQSENWTDSRRHGTHQRYSKLNHTQAAEIRRRHANGESGESLGREFGISGTQARNIAAGKQWAVEAPIAWPLPNVWKGVSVEDQVRADERIPDLLATPAAVRFLSCEPLLGPVDLTNIPVPDRPLLHVNALTGDRHCGPARFIPEPGSKYHFDTKIHWVICGGESGPKARPMHPDWARSLRDQCAAADVPFFFKQWGEWAPDEPGFWSPNDPKRTSLAVDRKLQSFERVGKKKAGRLLDGEVHDGMPGRHAQSEPHDGMPGGPA